MSASVDRGTRGPRVGAGRPRTRASSKRNAIIEVLGDSEDFRSAQDIHELMRRTEQKVGLATVYRTLQAMSEAGEVDSLRAENGEITYRRCSESHHHHLVCRVCGKAVEVRGPAVEKWADRMAAEHGFRDVSHLVEIFGTCSAH
jgi:Fur family ferric uptake transcriptional regulator